MHVCEAHLTETWLACHQPWAVAAIWWPNSTSRICHVWCYCIVLPHSRHDNTLHTQKHLYIRRSTFTYVQAPLTSAMCDVIVSCCHIRGTIIHYIRRSTFTYVDTPLTSAMCDVIVSCCHIRGTIIHYIRRSSFTYVDALSCMLQTYYMRIG